MSGRRVEDKVKARLINVRGSEWREVEAIAERSRCTRSAVVRYAIKRLAEELRVRELARQVPKR